MTLTSTCQGMSHLSQKNVKLSATFHPELGAGMERALLTGALE